MITVGIGRYALSADESETLITHALGSCVALIIRCPVTKLTALAHIVLPEGLSYDQVGFTHDRPAYFAKEIIPILLKFFIETKQCDKRILMVDMIGGAEALNEGDVFQVGRRNALAILSLLEEYKIKPQKIEVGGHYSRTVSVAIKDGKIDVKRQKMIL
jgi:chemotaxis protein CheD